MGIAVPAIVSNFFGFTMAVTNTVFAGHLGDSDSMAGVGIGATYLNIAVISFMLGFNSTLNTLLPQAKGFGDYHLCGVYLNRGVIVLSAALVPLGIFLTFSYPVFRLIGLEHGAAALGQTYINYSLPGMLFLGLSDINRRFLQVMGYQTGPMFITIFFSVIHAVFVYLLSEAAGLKVMGIGLATTMSNLVNMIACYIFTTKFTEARLLKEAWFLPKGAAAKECFNVQGLLEYFKIGLSCIGMSAFEWWSYELMLVFAARLSVNESATQVIILNYCSLAFMLPLGFSISASIFVGKEVGAQNLKGSRFQQRNI